MTMLEANVKRCVANPVTSHDWFSFGFGAALYGYGESYFHLSVFDWAGMLDACCSLYRGPVTHYWVGLEPW